MPTYDYQCNVCGTAIEVTCKIAERPESLPCSQCNGLMYQVITTANIRCSDVVNVPWIRRAMNYLEPGKAAQYDSREKYEKYLKDKNLRPADGHNLSSV